MKMFRVYRSPGVKGGRTRGKSGDWRSQNTATTTAMGRICQRLTLMTRGTRFGGRDAAPRGKPMDQMNVSITDRLAGYVRKKVKSGRYNNASEAVREALRRRAAANARPARLVSH